ncbi:MAG: carboxypeptidase regulatory-like domain-containing protein, partial [Candidatus Sericytochromatia bacterium]|nr:carboxypeptidase regulatory-like domain-containing protein [Candidatus Sericytochromatia bacterium]
GGFALRFKNLRRSLLLTLALSVAACQGGAPSQTGGNTTAAAANVAVPKGSGMIRGTVSVDQAGGGLISAGGRNYSLKQAPASGGSVAARGDGATVEGPIGPDGSFALVVPEGADYTLEAAVPDGKGGVTKVVSPTPISIPVAEEPPIVDAVSLVTRRTGSIQGLIELKDAKEGEDPEGVDVFLSGGTSVVGKAGKTGRFALTNVAEGTWNVVVSTPGYKRQVVKGVVVKAGRPAMLDAPVVLERETAPRAGVTGSVQTSDGSAILGATVSFYPKDRAALGADDVGLDNFTAITNDEGRYEMLNLPPGEYSVQVYRAFYKLPPRRSITVAAGAPQDLGVTRLASTVAFFGKVSGQVKDEAGNPVDGAVAQLDPPVTDQQFGDAAGKFTLDRILPGEYNLTISAGGFKPVIVPVVVDNKANFVLNLPPQVLPANKPLNDEALPSEPGIGVVSPDDIIGPNSDIYTEVGEDPAVETPAPASGALNPTITYSDDERPARVVVTLSGLVGPDGNPVELDSGEVTVVEDGKVKAAKFTEAEKSGRSLPVDVAFIIDVTGSMGSALQGVKKSALKFVESLYARNIDAQVGAVAYSDGLEGNPAGLIPANDPGALTVWGFEYLTPFADDDGLVKPPSGERTLRANRVTNFLSLLTPNGGMDIPEGMLDSIWWAHNNGKGASKSGASEATFGWRAGAQRVYVAMTDAPVWEQGGAEISPASTWTVPKLAERLRADNAVVHVVAPDIKGLGANSGSARGLAQPLAEASSRDGASEGTGGTWTPLLIGSEMDLTTLPVAKILGNSIKLEFISYVSAEATGQPPREHQLRVIVRKGELQGETTLTAVY